MNIKCWLGLHNWMEWLPNKNEAGTKEVCLDCWRVRWFFWDRKTRKALKECKR